MKTTSSFSFYCRGSKCNKRGLAPIELSISINGKRVFVNLPRKEDPDFFARCMSKRTPNDIKDFCSEYQKRANQVMTDLLVSGSAITAQNIRDGLINGVMTVRTVSVLWNEYLKILEKRIDQDLTFAVYRKYEYVRERVIDIIGDVDIKSVNLFMAKKVQTHIYTTYKESTAAGYITKVKTLFKYAYDCGYISSNPFGQIKIKKGTPNTIFLTRDELAIIENKAFEIERLERVRKLFLLECYTGMSYCDIQSMDVENIQCIGGNYIYVGNRQKTRVKYTSVFFPGAIDIIRAGIPKISNQRLNAYLKEIQDICGIEKNLHSHLARHTYAHLMVSAGVNMTTISHLLGHSSPTITAKVYAIPDNYSLVNEAAKAFN